MRPLKRGFIRRQVRARPLASFAAVFLIGLCAAKRWPVPLAASLCGGALALTAMLALGLRRRRFDAAVLLLALCLGMARMTLALDAVPPVETRYSVPMTGRIVNEPFTNPVSGRVIAQFRVSNIDGQPADVRLRLYLRGDDEAALQAIEYGQELLLTGHIWKPDPVTNPFEFDFGDYLRRDGLRGYATAKIADVTVLGLRTDLRSHIIALRRALAARIDALFPGNAALVRALVLGDRSLLSDEQREALNRTGTAHLISISGLHVTVLAALLAFVLGLFMPGRRARILSLILLIPYGALIGFSAPYVRALIMFAVFSLAPIAGYPSDSITRLCLAMLAYLLWRPMDVSDAGFALSFSASAGILLLMPPLTTLFGLRAPRHAKPHASRVRRLLHRAWLYFPTLLCASLAAQLATLPYVVAFFGVQSVVSLPFNLVCVPLCMLGYLGALAVLLISFIWMPLGAFLAQAPDWLFARLVEITRWHAMLPQASVRVGRYPFPLVLLHWALLLAASELSRIPLKLRRFMPFALALVAVLSSLLIVVRSQPFSIVFLDAGQADCAVIRSRGHTYLMDVGDTYTPAADYLGATCLHLDGVILSHPHQDHAGGLGDILAAFTPDAIYVPKGWYDAEDVAEAITEGMDRAAELGVPIIELTSGDRVELSDRASMTVYSPVEGVPPQSVNDLSLLALIECEGQSALFTGDLSMNGEPEVIPDADLLKVAHHGSDKATSERFLAACTPDIAVISVGENSYSHPGEVTLEKLGESGADIYLTRSCGAITMIWRRGAWQIKTYLEASDALE